ncbi:HAD superfamily (subfamily IA) hydrolase, TIGR02253 [Methanocaldococcus infernus ME]|uniref:Glyceraldehyde 3-phosphate phosphatase n=1 Tax=Methanocaldococcus infernus (strain DSM 11812 / JCM 15783 / ME) TaxID=573063 RepID=D5VSB7_METIM|nr:TIGR02253 family HAD-type hydrolase [Methanocaldococcus infernus]ADG13470.1 HAD superfamily (subfamily IA) hydrolase, TIGR02253 [Methanocaldococcus infernus ME]
MIKGILFDLDDTLYNSSEFVSIARREAVKSMIDAGLNVSLDEAMEILNKIIKDKGSNYGKHFDDLVKSVLGRYDPMIIATGIITYHNVKVALLRPYPNTIKTLIELKKMSLKLGVLTDGLTIKQWEKLIRLGIHTFFDEVITSEEFGLGKPHLEFFKYGLKRFGLKGEEVIYVGDRIDRDIEPAKKVGMITVRILRGKYKDMEGKADYTIKDLWELIEIVKKLREGGQ